MILITQLIYIKAGQEQVFDEFEAVAIPLVSKYNGRLLLRVRPDEKNFIEAGTELPYEIHLVEFPAEADFEQFMKDPIRASLLHLKEKSIRASVLIKGQKL